MEDYKPNSDKSKQVPVKPKVEAVVEGTATVKKKSEFKKFTESLVTRDFASIRAYVVGDVLIPAGKRAIEELIHMILHGEASRGTSSPGTIASKVSYRSFWDKRDEAMRLDGRGAAPVRPQVRAGYSYDDVIFETLKDAEDVRERMCEMISMYGIVSIADLYDMARIADDNYTNNNYGWADISASRTLPVTGGGYILKLPKAMPLN